MHTIDVAFLRQDLADGNFEYTDPLTGEIRIVNGDAIYDTALMTIEGKKDDITGLGQTQAAHDIAGNIPDTETMRQHYVQEGVGHYGIFNGSKFRNEIATRIIAFTSRVDHVNGLDYHVCSETVDALTDAGLWHEEKAPVESLEI